MLPLGDVKLLTWTMRGWGLDRVSVVAVAWVVLALRPAVLPVGVDVALAVSVDELAAPPPAEVTVTALVEPPHPQSTSTVATATDKRRDTDGQPIRQAGTVATGAGGDLPDHALG
jgi:hypothetical protein